MRFAYIDSQGNEVSIPSVDALALRIELGAIGPETQLYDAQADRWGPAQTHEIFHTLSRDTAGEGGFVAPPPPVAPPPAAEPPPPGAEPDAPPAEGRPVFDVAADLGLTPAAPAEAPAAGSTPAGHDAGFDFTFTESFAPASDEAPPEVVEDALPTFTNAPDEPEAPQEEEGPSGFDFGDLGSLELEAGPFEEPEPVSSAGDDTGESMDPAPGAMDFASPGGMGGLDLEPPMSEFTPEAPPSWMERSGAADGEGAMDFGGGAPEGEERQEPPERRGVADEPTDEEAERPERPQPRSRPSPPRRPRRKASAGLLGGVAALALLGGGGFFGWKTFLQGGGEAPAQAQVSELPEVTIPDIPAELLPVLRDLGEAALAGSIQELSGVTEELGVPAEPNGDWLAGVYLANATRFRDVQEYWEGIGDFVDRVRDTDTQVFHAHYMAQLDAAGIQGDTASILLARADSGFLATRADRFEVYALMDDLVNASLELHRFLLRNEANIEYTPAAGGVSRDPVLEAVPASRELGNEMWDMVDGITAALDALGTLDRVTTERLSAVLFDRVRRAGFR